MQAQNQRNRGSRQSPNHHPSHRHAIICQASVPGLTMHEKCLTWDIFLEWLEWVEKITAWGLADPVGKFPHISTMHRRDSG
jgi:hypothetical protein